MTEPVPKWFTKKYKRFNKLVKKRGIQFFGLGLFATDKYGNHDKEVAELLLELMEYEPYVNWIRNEVFKLE